MGAVNTGFLTSNSLEKASSFFGVLIIRPRRKGPDIAPTVQRRRRKFREAGGGRGEVTQLMPTSAPALSVLGPRCTAGGSSGSGLCPWLR